MSTWLGSPEGKLPLQRAVDALAESARQAGRPGLVWLAGLFYPSVGIGIVGTFDATVPGMGVGGSPRGSWVQIDSGTQASPVFDFLLEAYAALFVVPFVAVLFLPLFRLVAGLAIAGSGPAWTSASEGRRTPRLRTLWRLGSGLTRSTYGLWLQLVLMQILAFLVLLAPLVAALRDLVHATEDERIGVLLGTGAFVGPFILLFGFYLLALSVLGQLALQSLVENRRGVSSALLHAWRIVRHDPPATARAVVAELLLFALTLVAVRAFAGILGDLPGHTGFVIALQIALTGFAGVVRAAYWARIYRALGGLTPADGVPGLAQRA